MLGLGGMANSFKMGQEVVCGPAADWVVGVRRFVLQVDQTDDPGFFVDVHDGTRAGLLERARRAPAEFFEPLKLQAGLRVLDVGCGTGDLLRLLAREAVAAHDKRFIPPIEFQISTKLRLLPPPDAT